MTASDDQSGQPTTDSTKRRRPWFMPAPLFRSYVTSPGRLRREAQENKVAPRRALGDDGPE